MTIRTMIEIIFFIVDPFKSYQILRSVVAIMLIVEKFLTVKESSTINTTTLRSW